jgi:NADH:ubiquinone oxidoreductase subunit F (NADH-binding)/(2Fe-2S) ferredoxin/Pyruvate/2-oxoacid:ferredoxin oxidoreductase delta subunit
VSRIGSVPELEAVRAGLTSARDPHRPIVTICSGTGCPGARSEALYDTFVGLAGKRGLTVAVKQTGCVGFCERGPIVIIRPQGIFYQHVKQADVPRILGETIAGGKVVEDLLYADPASGGRCVSTEQIPFYSRQKRIVLRRCGEIDPLDIRDSLAEGAYSALAKALFRMAPEEIIAAVEKSGLRGRGGGGYPTGRKWRDCRQAAGSTKYVVANADEGDPGAFMDRGLIEADPHSLVEGMVIGAFAIGASHGYVYIRNEYPLAVATLREALSQARDHGLLGRDILGSGFDFDIAVSRGAGAFVCGESTALMASIEGNPGEPRVKHTHTVESGLWEKPTNLNNVETWANIPLIINNGADWFRALGTEKSTGTKIFSLVGKIRNTGLVEVPMGITLREMVFDIGGGIPDGKAFKAVQTGGPSGGCLPTTLLDLKVDFDELKKHGSMMGSGGMIVMDEDTCMVEVARYFLNFLREESCGKCTSCREGLDVMYGIVSDICAGRGTEDQLPLLAELAEAVKDASLCALGTTATNPVMSTLLHFRDEYEAHIRDRRCPAGVCKALITYRIDPDKCTACLLCNRNCPSGAITGEKKKPQQIQQEKCIKCGACRDACKSGAVVVE